jgi:hypothetical protein
MKATSPRRGRGITNDNILPTRQKSKLNAFRRTTIIPASSISWMV